VGFIGISSQKGAATRMRHGWSRRGIWRRLSPMEFLPATFEVPEPLEH
jgi:hypothetical protein